MTDPMSDGQRQACWDFLDVFYPSFTQGRDNIETPDAELMDAVKTVVREEFAVI